MAIKILDKPNTEGISYDYPYGNIKDNPGDNTGTPVNKVVYADFHQFFAKMMDDAGISYNGLPDNATDGFQYWLALVEAVKNNCNFYTDISASVTENSNITPITKVVRQYSNGDIMVKFTGTITGDISVLSPILSGLPVGLQNIVLPFYVQNGFSTPVALNGTTGSGNISNNQDVAVASYNLISLHFIYKLA